MGGNECGSLLAALMDLAERGLQGVWASAKVEDASDHGEDRASCGVAAESVADDFPSSSVFLVVKGDGDVLRLAEVSL